MLFRKKPVEVEAMQLVKPFSRVRKWLDQNGADYLAVMEANGVTLSDIRIRTLEGDMKAEIGDWIIKGIAGEFYPCKPDIFVATYEPAEANKESGE